MDIGPAVARQYNLIAKNLPIRLITVYKQYIQYLHDNLSVFMKFLPQALLEFHSYSLQMEDFLRLTSLLHPLSFTFASSAPSCSLPSPSSSSCHLSSLSLFITHFSHLTL